MASSSFFSDTNPTPEGVATAQGILDSATAAATAAASSATSAASSATQANTLLQAYTVVQDAWAPGVTIDWGAANCHRLTLGGNTTITFTGGRDGEKLILEIKQDATGSRSVTLPANIRYSSMITTVALSAAPNAMDKLGFMYNAADDKYDLVAAAYGFI